MTAFALPGALLQVVQTRHGIIKGARAEQDRNRVRLFLVQRSQVGAGPAARHEGCATIVKSVRTRCCPKSDARVYARARCGPERERESGRTVRVARVCDLVARRLIPLQFGAFCAPASDAPSKSAEASAGRARAALPSTRTVGTLATESSLCPCSQRMFWPCLGPKPPKTTTLRSRPCQEWALFRLESGCRQPEVIARCRTCGPAPPARARRPSSSGGDCE